MRLRFILASGLFVCAAAPALAQPAYPAYTVLGAGSAAPQTSGRTNIGASNNLAPANPVSVVANVGYAPPTGTWAGDRATSLAQSLPPGGSATGAVRAEASANAGYSFEAARIALDGRAEASARTDGTPGVITGARGSFDVDIGVTFLADTNWTFSFVADSSPYKGAAINTFGYWNLVFGRGSFGDLINLPNVNIGAQSGTLSGTSAAGSSLIIQIGGGPSQLSAASFLPLAYEWGEISVELSFSSALTPAVPEPGTWAMWLAGLLIVPAVARRHRRR